MIESKRCTRCAEVLVESPLAVANATVRVESLSSEVGRMGDAVLCGHCWLSLIEFLTPLVKDDAEFRELSAGLRSVGR